MRIESKNQIESVYSSLIRKSSLQYKTPVGKENKLQQDRIEISSAAVNHDEVASLKQNIVNEVLKGASAEKMSKIKSEIENGTYYVDASEIAEAMLSKH